MPTLDQSRLLYSKFLLTSTTHKHESNPPNVVCNSQNLLHSHCDSETMTEWIKAIPLAWFLQFLEMLQRMEPTGERASEQHFVLLVPLHLITSVIENVVVTRGMVFCNFRLRKETRISELDNSKPHLYNICEICFHIDSDFVPAFAAWR